MKALLLGRKPLASAALRHVVERGIEVVGVVAEPLDVDRPPFWTPQLRETATELRIPILSERSLYEDVEAGKVSVDLVLSVLYERRLLPPLIALPRLGCFNFHPAPLPEFRGRRGYNFAILEDHREYGASIHWVTDRFDEGPLVEVATFPITPTETALSLEGRTIKVLFEMLKGFVDKVLSGEPIPSIPQGPGKSATKQQLLEAARVLPDDDAETVNRKVRAFWYPPYTGAFVTVNGIDYTLVDSTTIDELGRVLHQTRSQL